ncbi:SDR family oxidoreductase [Pedobacter cryophilus]|uniref:SDR family oxidoreductase n=1 Tax=Pedobacter cryophilus TaxID=2571271 RepID=A0A4U1C3I0_9SPHI|nr:SDR family oxidoreductase [Pedobacter cryophilus]TKB98866.1 SDR family oxidoreductase [Pedobacter cryophilus]
MNSWNLNHKKVLITGGTKGIGKATVEAFAELGAIIIFTARNKDEVMKMEQEYVSKGYHVMGFVADVTLAKDRLAVVDHIHKLWGKLDVLVNNAGMNIRKKTIEYTEEEYQKVYHTNFFSAFEFCRLCYPYLLAAKNSAIINVASVAGSFDVGTGSPYATSKAAMIQMSKSLAVEWAKEGIRVNTVSPWFTVTPLTTSYLADLERLEKIQKRTPIGRVAQAEEVASAIAFFAMDKASYISGQHLIIDGGLTSGVF